MALKSGSGKKPGSIRRGNAGKRDRPVAGQAGEYLALFQRMVDKAADMVFLLGPMGRILYANEAASKALGYTREELRSMTVFGLNQKHHADNWLEHEEELKEQGSMTFENVLRTKDNRLIPVEISANYARLGDKEYNYSFIRDITERKRAEEVMRESEARRKVAEAVESERRRLFDVLEALPAMICLLTPDYHVAFANRSFREKFGESHGRHCNDYCFGRAGPCEFCESYRVLETGKPHHWEVTGPDGSMIDVYDIPFTDADGSPMVLEMDIDITESRRAGEALRESEEKFRALAETADTPITIFRDGEYIYVNRAAAEATGHTVEELMGIDPLETIYPDDRVKAGKSITMLERGEKTRDRQEIRILRKDGSLCWIDVSATPISYHGKDAIISIALDITERRRAEDIIRTSAVNLARAEKLAGLGYWDWDLTTNSVKWSDGHFRVFGYPVAHGTETYGMFRVRVHPDDIEGVERVLREGMEKDTGYNWDYRLVWPDGSIRYIHAEADRPVKDARGRPIRWFGIVQDVTEHKLAEEALRLARFSVDRAAYGIFWIARDGRIFYANYSACEMLGYPVEKLQGIHVWDFDLLYSREVWPSHWQDLKRQGSINFESRYRASDGRVFPVEITANYLEFEGKEYNFAFIRDIARRKQAEEELKAARDQAELYLDLMGHDINNIHQAALGYLELARDLPGDARDEYLDKATEALKRSARLINNVRKLQKFQDNRRVHDVDVCAVLAGVHGEYAEARGKVLSLDLGGRTHCHVRADDLLHDVFSNLVGNAVKHTGDDASISINLDVVREDGGKYCRVRVEDDGPGIPDESKKTLFDRSLKGTPRIKGTGLGLYIVKTLVENYRGRVWVEDRIPGDHTKGARFVVMLPSVDG